MKASLGLSCVFVLLTLATFVAELEYSAFGRPVSAFEAKQVTGAYCASYGLGVYSCGWPCMVFGAGVNVDVEYDSDPGNVQFVNTRCACSSTQNYQKLAASCSGTPIGAGPGDDP